MWPETRVSFPRLSSSPLFAFAVGAAGSQTPAGRAHISPREEVNRPNRHNTPTRWSSNRSPPPTSVPPRTSWRQPTSPGASSGSASGISSRTPTSSSVRDRGEFGSCEFLLRSFDSILQFVQKSCGSKRERFLCTHPVPTPPRSTSVNVAVCSVAICDHTYVLVLLSFCAKHMEPHYFWRERDRRSGDTPQADVVHVYAVNSHFHPLPNSVHPLTFQAQRRDRPQRYRQIHDPMCHLPRAGR